MGVTRLKRKARRNKQTAAKRQNSMQQLNRKPVIKNIDKEAAKAAFGAAPVKEEAPAPAVEETQEEVVVAEVAVEETPAVEEPQAEAEEAPVAEAVEEASEEVAEETSEEVEEATEESADEEAAETEDKEEA